MNKIFNSAKTQSQLSEIVESLLEKHGEREQARGETYLETATRLQQTHPRLVELLIAAERRWFELEK